DLSVKAFGCHVTVTLDDGRTIADEIAVADAHPLGARPWRRPDYVVKFRTLADGVVSEPEQARFLAAVERLPDLPAGELTTLNFAATNELAVPRAAGLFGSSWERPLFARGESHAAGKL